MLYVVSVRKPGDRVEALAKLEVDRINLVIVCSVIHFVDLVEQVGGL